MNDLYTLVQLESSKVLVLKPSGNVDVFGGIVSAKDYLQRRANHLDAPVPWRRHFFVAGRPVSDSGMTYPKPKPAPKPPPHRGSATMNIHYLHGEVTVRHSDGSVLAGPYRMKDEAKWADLFDGIVREIEDVSK